MSTIHSELFYISHILTKTFKYLGVICVRFFFFLLIYIFHFMPDMVYTQMFKHLGVIFAHLHILFYTWHGLHIDV